MRKFVSILLVITTVFLFSMPILAAEEEVIDFGILTSNPLLGDANDNGKVMLNDVIIAMKILSGENVKGFEAWRCDANGDGFLTVSDLVLTMKNIVNS